MEEDKYFCEECNKNYVSKESFDKHYKYAKIHKLTANSGYKCEQCGTFYSTKTNLATHQKRKTHLAVVEKLELMNQNIDNQTKFFINLKNKKGEIVDKTVIDPFNEKIISVRNV